MDIVSKPNGFLACGTFVDNNGESCSLQESSVATASLIWLGRDGPDGMERMHLTQEAVAALLPHLHHFVETGRLNFD